MLAAALKPIYQADSARAFAFGQNPAKINNEILMELSENLEIRSYGSVAHYCCAISLLNWTGSW